MCDAGLIITGLTIAASAASAVTSYVGQSHAAAAQEQYQQKLATDQALYRNAVAKQANQSFIDQSYQQNLKLQQDAAAATDQNFQKAQEAAQARARVRTAAGEAGVAGLSVDSLLNDFQRQQEYSLQNSNTNLLFEQKQAAENIRGMRADAISKVSGVRQYIPAPVQHPSLVATGLDVVGSALGAANQYYQYKHPQ